MPNGSLGYPCTSSPGIDAVGLGWSASRLSTWVIASQRATPTTIALTTSHRALPRTVTMIQPKRASATTASGTGRRSAFVRASTAPRGLRRVVDPHHEAALRLRRSRL